VARDLAFRFLKDGHTTHPVAALEIVRAEHSRRLLFWLRREDAQTSHMLDLTTSLAPTTSNSDAPAQERNLPKISGGCGSGKIGCVTWIRLDRASARSATCYGSGSTRPSARISSR
jgi:hypothetical protein